jgi:hypothetical protein
MMVEATLKEQMSALQSQWEADKVQIANLTKTNIDLNSNLVISEREMTKDKMVANKRVLNLQSQIEIVGMNITNHIKDKDDLKEQVLELQNQIELSKTKLFNSKAYSDSYIVTLESQVKNDKQNLNEQVLAYGIQIEINRNMSVAFLESKTDLGSRIVLLECQIKKDKNVSDQHTKVEAALREQVLDLQRNIEAATVELTDLSTSKDHSDRCIVTLESQLKVEKQTVNVKVSAYDIQIKINKDMSLLFAKSKADTDNHMVILNSLIEGNRIQLDEQTKAEAALLEQMLGLQSQIDMDKVKSINLLKIISDLDNYIVLSEGQMESDKMTTNEQILSLQSQIDTNGIELSSLISSKANLDDQIVALISQNGKNKVQLDNHTKGEAALNTQVLGLQKQIKFDGVKLANLVKDKDDLISQIVRLESQVEKDKIAMNEQVLGLESQIELDGVKLMNLMKDKEDLNSYMVVIENKMEQDKTVFDEKVLSLQSLIELFKLKLTNLTKSQSHSDSHKLSLVSQIETQRKEYKVRSDDYKTSEAALSQQLADSEDLAVANEIQLNNLTKSKTALDKQVIVLKCEIEKEKVQLNELTGVNLALSNQVCDLSKAKVRPTLFRFF